MPKGVYPRKRDKKEKKELPAKAGPKDYVAKSAPAQLARIAQEESLKRETHLLRVQNARLEEEVGRQKKLIDILLDRISVERD